VLLLIRLRQSAAVGAAGSVSDGKSLSAKAVAQRLLLLRRLRQLSSMTADLRAVTGYTCNND